MAYVFSNKTIRYENTNTQTHKHTNTQTHKHTTYTFKNKDRCKVEFTGIAINTQKESQVDLKRFQNTAIIDLMDLCRITVIDSVSENLCKRNFTSLTRTIYSIDRNNPSDLNSRLFLETKKMC